MWTKEVLCSNMKAGSTFSTNRNIQKWTNYVTAIHVFLHLNYIFSRTVANTDTHYYQPFHLNTGNVYMKFSFIITPCWIILPYGGMKEIFQISYIKLFKIKPFDSIMVRTRIIFVQQNWSCLNKPFNDRQGIKKHKNV